MGRSSFFVSERKWAPTQRSRAKNEPLGDGMTSGQLIPQVISTFRIEQQIIFPVCWADKWGEFSYLLAFHAPEANKVRIVNGSLLGPDKSLVALTVIGAGLCMQWRYVEYSFRCPYCGRLNERKYSLPADSEQDAAGTVTTKTHLCDQCEMQLTADSLVNFSRNDPTRKDS